MQRVTLLHHYILVLWIVLGAHSLGYATSRISDLTDFNDSTAIMVTNLQIEEEEISKIIQNYQNYRFSSGGEPPRNDALEQDMAEALAYLQKKAILLSDANAAFQVATFIKHGMGTSQNIKEAITWYEKADTLLHPEAANNLGVIYDWGLYGISSDTTKAIKYYEQSINLGSTLAIKNLNNLLNRLNK